MSTFGAKLGARDALRAIKVDYLTVFPEIVELTNPVRAYGEHINSHTSDVVNLLALVLFNDYFVSNPELLDRTHALVEGLGNVNLPAHLVEAIGGYAHDQVVAERLGAFQQAHMAPVQKVVRSICDHFPHGPHLPFRGLFSNCRSARASRRGRLSPTHGPRTKATVALCSSTAKV